MPQDQESARDRATQDGQGIGHVPMVAMDAEVRVTPEACQLPGCAGGER